MLVTTLEGVSNGGEGVKTEEGDGVVVGVDVKVPRLEVASGEREMVLDTEVEEDGASDTDAVDELVGSPGVLEPTTETLCEVDTVEVAEEHSVKDVVAQAVALELDEKEGWRGVGVGSHGVVLTLHEGMAIVVVGDSMGV